MNEIDDYAPVLLRIKAAVKELETALPAGEWGKTEICAAQIANAADALGVIASEKMYCPA